MGYRPRVATEEELEKMRSCLHSRCETSDKVTPIYVCNLKKKMFGGEPTCKLYDRSWCDDHEPFPEGQNT